MTILGIESSCDDTSVALVEAKNGYFNILSEKTASQIPVHKKYGGVVPEIAGRLHAENIIPTIEAVIQEAGMKNSEKPDYIAATSGPGLITGLIVGVEAGKSLSYLLNIPLIGINHIEGHIYSVLLEKTKEATNIKFPALCLITSGGHTEIILMKDHGKYVLIGKTLDDAAGECFDKVGKLLGFDYPGGPKVSQQALKGSGNAIPLPRPMINENNYDFSFAGLKTAALYWLKDNAQEKDNKFQLKKEMLNDFCASLETAIIEVLTTKTLKAMKEYNPKTVILAGGVSANNKLRNTLKSIVSEHDPSIQFLLPEPKYTMDNGAMIAAAGYFHAQNNKKKMKDNDDIDNWKKVKADPNWGIYETKD